MKNLMIMTLTALTIAAGAEARADGFRCVTEDGSLALKAYNHTSPQAGTRSVAVLVLSDPAVSQGRKTIAKFTDAKQSVSSRGASYVADVDLRLIESRRKGELIAVGGQRTKLGQLDEIRVNIDFSYLAPLKDGEELGGEIVLVKRNGEKLSGQLECIRHLKN